MDNYPDVGSLQLILVRDEYTGKYSDIVAFGDKSKYDPEEALGIGHKVIFEADYDDPYMAESKADILKEIKESLNSEKMFLPDVEDSFPDASAIRYMNLSLEELEQFDLIDFKNIMASYRGPSIRSNGTEDFSKEVSFNKLIDSLSMEFILVLNNREIQPTEELEPLINKLDKHGVLQHNENGSLSIKPEYPLANYTLMR